MFEIEVTYYNTIDDTHKVTVFAYNIIDAIDIVRHHYNYKIFVVKAEYCDISKVIQQIKS